MVILKIIPQLLNLTSNFEKKARCRMCLSYYKNTHSKKYPKKKRISKIPHFKIRPRQSAIRAGSVRLPRNSKGEFISRFARSYHKQKFAVSEIAHLKIRHFKNATFQKYPNPFSIFSTRIR